MNNSTPFKCVMVIIFFACLFSVQAQKADAHVILEEVQKKVDIRSIEESHTSEYYRITINSKKKPYADGFLTFPYSDGNEKISKLTCHVYDANGDEILKLKKKDFFDVAAYDNISIITDARALYYKLPDYALPITLVIECEQTKKYAMSYSWRPIWFENAHIKRASYEIQAPVDFGLQIREQHITNSNNQVIDGKRKFNWEVKNFTIADRKFKFEIPLSDRVPMVDCVPKQFRYDDVDGSFSSWQAFGQWLVALNQNSTSLPADAHEDVASLLTDDMTPGEKVCTLYEYMQDRTRYVSIQLGIGGWKPFDATFVHEKQYGDCKALSTYMKALLESAGIPSHYAIINAGAAHRHHVSAAFPSNRFNHAVLLVPVENDTILLECTSQESPCGFQSPFTDHRYALVIADNASKLIKTRGFGLADNFRRDSATLSIAIDGQATLALHRTSSGIFASNYRLLNAPSRDQINDFSASLKFGQFNTSDYSIEAQADGHFDLDILEKATCLSRSFVSASGQRLFVPTQTLQVLDQPRLPDSIHHSFTIARPYQQAIDILMTIPEGYELEGKPIDQELSSRFGTYQKRLTAAPEGGYHLVRSYTMNAGEYNVDDYTEYASFARAVGKAEKKDIVFVKSK